MLKEAIEVIRALWSGNQEDYHGACYTVENARIYTLPETAPEILIAASGKKSAEFRGQQWRWIDKYGAEERNC